MNKKKALEDLYGGELEDDLDISDISESEEHRPLPVPRIQANSDDELSPSDEEDQPHPLHQAASDQAAVALRVANSQAAMRDILQGFDQEQLLRYETFRRVGFNRQAVKKIIQRVFEMGAAPVNPNSVIIVAGIAKVFCGELVELAREIMETAGESGPITPFFILEAHRRLQSIGLLKTVHQNPCI